MEWVPWLLLVVGATVFGQWLIVLTWRLTEQRDKIADIDERCTAVHDENTRIDTRLCTAEWKLRQTADPILFSPRSAWCHVVDTTQVREGES